MKKIYILFAFLFFASNYIQAQCADIVIGVEITMNSAFGEEVNWELLDGAGAVVATGGACVPGTGGPFDGVASGTVFTTNVTVTAGDMFTLNALDDWGDGTNSDFNIVIIDEGSCEPGSVTIDSGGALPATGVTNGVGGDGSVDCNYDIEGAFPFTVNCTCPVEPATCDDITLAVVANINSAFPEEVNFELLDGAGTVIATGDACVPGAGTSFATGQVVMINFTAADGDTFTLNALDDWGDGTNSDFDIIVVSEGSCEAGTVMIDSGGALPATGVTNGAGGDGSVDCNYDIEGSFPFSVSCVCATEGCAADGGTFGN